MLDVIIQSIGVALLVILPVWFGLKTGTFGWMARALIVEDSTEELGIWLERLFASLTATSLCLTAIFAAFAYMWWDAELVRWVPVMLVLQAALLATIYCGWRVRRAYEALDEEDRE